MKNGSYWSLSGNNCATWISESNTSTTTTIKIDSDKKMNDEGGVTVYYVGMCTQSKDTVSTLKVNGANGAFGRGDENGEEFTRSGTWGSPTSKATNLDVAKFIEGIEPTKTDDGGLSYERKIGVYRCHSDGGSCSTQYENMKVIIYNSYFEGYSGVNFGDYTVNTGWKNSGTTLANLTIPCTNTNGECEVSFSHGARRTSGKSNGNYEVSGAGGNTQSGSFGEREMSISRNAKVVVGDGEVCDQNIFTTGISYNEKELGKATTQACVSAPYNFTNNLEVEVLDPVYAGEAAKMNLTAWVSDLYSRDFGDYHTVGKATLTWQVEVGGRVYATQTEKLERYTNYKLTEKTVNVPDVRAGSDFCIVATLTPASSDDNSGSITKSDCKTVKKKPSLQVWGGEIYSSGDISSLLAGKRNLGSSYSLDGGVQKTFGSWSELAVISDGEVKNFASGAALVNGGSLGNLTFAEIGIGKDNKVQNLLVILEDNEKATVIKQNTITKDDAKKINDGYDSTISDLKDLTIKVIYATGDLNISCDAEEIDAILIAEGTVRTCADANGKEPDVDDSSRSHPLRINGAVVAKKLILGRTYGAATGDNSSKPAEIINMGVVNDLWGARESEKSGKLYTVYTKEVAPRY